MKQSQSFKLLPSRMSGVEATVADSSMTFSRHTHDQFGIGLMERGGHRSSSGRGIVEAWPGDVITVNPGEVHDGAPIGSVPRAWRMLYLEPAVIADAAEDVGEQTRAQGEFATPVVRDKLLALRFRQLFDGATGALSSALQLEEALLLLVAPLVRRDRAERPGIPTSIRSARSMMDDDPAAVVTLTRLAEEAGLSRFQFLRRFALLTGLTPHAYLMQRRVHLARRLIRRGMKPAEAAAASGFADQSHLTRTFVRTFGLTPGACGNTSR